ncbi:UNKNOWN [Stylonychia lemnae]|uniref:Uncharacterized protein n=1 Tax=Stylonychia lemnae TaxID=5949 RepID=A0A078BDD5_STYLE|nr:UNKNOWN [Stylonychia lemnae]|eukprot:CDW91217.1 UNKNOWN [Stylonychia lemnae]
MLSKLFNQNRSQISKLISLLPYQNRSFAGKRGKFEYNPDSIDKNPFNIKLNKDKEGKKTPSTLEKIKSYFSQKSKSFGEKKEESKEPTANEIFQQQKAKDNKDQPIQKDSKEQQDTVNKIIEMISKNINRKYFSEKKLPRFLELCFSVKDLNLLTENEKFDEFIYQDLKFLIQSVKDVQNINHFVKFAVYFKLESDPELLEILADQVRRSIGRFKTDEILEILVNFSHTLSPECKSLFEIANEDFVFRLTTNYDPMEGDLLIQLDDIPKILNTFLDLQQLSASLKEKLQDYYVENVNSFSYKTLSEIAVIYASKMDQTYKELFFGKFKDKFLKDLKHLDQEIFYKVLWSLIKADTIEVDDRGFEWSLIKETIIKRAKDFDPATVTNILVLSTTGKTNSEKIVTITGDLFDALQSELIIKMQSMNLSDLINLMWSISEIKKGSQLFYSELEKQITLRLRSINDDDLLLLLDCFSDMQNSFSQKFLDIIINVIQEKKDRFQLKTLVNIIFAFSKIDFDYTSIQQILLDFRDYERLIVSLPNMLQKSQCILLWTYSRNEQIIDANFLQKICQAILHYESGVFELDNFDLLLLSQSIMHIQRSELSKDADYMQQFYDLAKTAETFAIKNIERMNIHEFATIMLFYLQNDQCITKQLIEKMIPKIEDCVSEFNELQLSMIQKAIIKFAIKNQEKYERTLFQQCLEKLQEELDGIQLEKEFIESEERILETIRERIKQRIENEPKPFKPHYTPSDSKLEQQVPESKPESIKIIDNSENIKKDINKPQNFADVPDPSKISEAEANKFNEQQSQDRQSKTSEKDDREPIENEKDRKKLLKYLLNRKK